QWFQRIEPGKAPATFKGTLRAYQREGLGWMQMLRRFGLGGCLADDMGLGKTVQVLALLENRRLELREIAEQLESGELKDADGKPVKEVEKGPSLVVVPRSLMFNWRQEISRFAPQLKTLEHFGLSRPKDAKGFKGCDIVLTTYGTLRRDITFLKDIEFDYAILDEAQAVKNAATASSKAVRLIQARHRLALSGTPVENHIGELWNLLEFLNPGMFGSINGIDINAPVDVMAKTLRPLILRRTKDQVARDLPAKTEQTLTCELEGEQLKVYEKIRNHYRHTLLARVDRDGMASSQMEVLEALLRLRQVACHPGLVDKEVPDDVPCAKLELLIPQLEEVIEGGHKALVFSQFTSFLTYVKEALEKAKIPYVYLDGKTRDRGAKVDEFQNDPKKRIFLISLKAGGVGLNLTAAEYVFILDPWWNPAVEAQAVDRAHRIGQTKKVFAYRIVAKNTVEERILEMQKDKKELAEAILGGGDGVLKKLSREDLERLLG
ncbi:MAG: DEAD/DEAH box helicase, partial [Planctomycetota bacterium]